MHLLGDNHRHMQFMDFHADYFFMIIRSYRR